jgi:hypothetical protein
MDSDAQRIAWLRLALAEVLSSPDIRTAKIAEIALDADDKEMRAPSTGHHRTLPPSGKPNAWLAED